jgi:hypothetical protein
LYPETCRGGGQRKREGGVRERGGGERETRCTKPVYETGNVCVCKRERGGERESERQ